MSNKAHKHANMIKAKADNMELVVFCEGNGKWIEVTCTFGEIAWWEDKMYFLCLPQHKEVCLHWLNGGEVECNSKYTNGWDTCHDINNITWSTCIGLMRDDAKYRIKPRKEKRWIGVYGKHVTKSHFKCESEAKAHVDSSPVYSNCSPESWQLIEIEIEV